MMWLILIGAGKLLRLVRGRRPDIDQAKYRENRHRKTHLWKDASSPSQAAPIPPQADSDLLKKQQPPQAASAFYSSINTVLSANPTNFWNSAQEAFSSIPLPSYPSANSFYPPTTDFERFVEPPEPVLPEFSVFGNPIDLISFTMPSRDRTAEFRTTAKSYEMKAQANGFRPQAKQAVLQEKIQFNKLAKSIGKDLAHTCAKMEKLAEMAKKKTLFDEREEVEHMSKDITGLNRQIAALQEFCQRRQNGVVNTQGTDHSKRVVVGLQSKLANVSKDFQSVLEVSTETMKQQQSRRQKFSNGESFPLLPSSSNQTARSRLLQDDEHSGSAVALDMGAMEQMRQQQQVVFDDTNKYVQARADTMQSIEGSISELGQIFNQLAVLVNEQGEMISRIDSNVEDTALNIDMAHSELVKYFHNISKNRWLMIKIFGVLLVFSIIFIIFLT
ncbi:hypothetical protein WR25_21521 [Diploscapter pachys]|uniref:t-SNARE coiled-coil homology domain-containing protein n=1 Tax=Diploscapter pachys TaxID=2018661 RepID=A0A2A2L3A9_9BILA|nr:hypothetical protein WR25_21521 [Diploscapter pachys]